MAQGVWISADGIAKFGTGVVTHIFENAALLSVDTDLIPNEVETSWGRHLGNGTHPALGFR
ncbi:uncharacterized protein BJX67DRAFT_352743 [Aspergillus lucknowensis]|uniref:Uncharacterized protein n=1 Tax=Aspergillus lucknowensis TaxID=176173 RepID=A0ABR4LSV8_9EURO